MQKAVAALEKNVEWIALGLAGIWVLWIVWAYVITKPVAVDIGDEKVSAAEVDDVIAREGAEKLKNVITERGAAPTIVVPPIELAFDVQAPPPMAAPPIESAIVRATNIEDQLPPDPNNPNAPRIVAAGDKVAQLPAIPAPRIVEVVADKGQVIPPVQQPNVDQFGREGDFAAAQPLLPPQPAQQVAPDAGGANVVPVNARDAWWVWITARLDEGAIQQNFTAAKIPRNLNRMEYLAVEVQREELMPDGTWGNAKMVPPLKHNAPPPELDRQRVPLEYLSWALRPENQYLILEPTFYQTVAPFKIPLHLQPRVQVIADQGLPQYQDMAQLAAEIESGNMLPTVQRQIENSLTPEQKRDLYRELTALREERRRQDAQQRASERNSREQQRRSTRGTRSYAPVDPELMGEMLASGGAPAGTRGYNPRGDYYRRGSSGVGIPMINPTPAVNPIDPTQMNVVRPGGIVHPDGRITFGEFDVWAYDETVEPGKTYRYRMRVVLKNPVFRMAGAVADPKLAEIMELPADRNAGWSDWSRPIVVDRGVEMFLAGTGRDNVRFDIYRWQDGRVNKQQFTAAPGDVIGSKDTRTNIDFNTGYAVVDIRQIANRDYRVTLIDPNGAQVVRTYQEDQNNPKRTNLEAEASKPANPALTDLR